MINLNHTALLVVDVQKGFEHPTHWGEERNNPDAEEKIVEILQKSREAKLPVYLVKHNSTNTKSPLHISQPGNAFIEGIKPQSGETVIEKDVNSAFIGTPLEELLKEQQVTHVIIIGLTTDHCISTTVRMAANLGFTTYLVEDATVTYNKKGTDGINYPAKLIHDTAIASLKDEFATIISAKELISKLEKMALAKP